MIIQQDLDRIKEYVNTPLSIDMIQKMVRVIEMQREALDSIRCYCVEYEKIAIIAHVAITETEKIWEGE